MIALSEIIVIASRGDSSLKNTISVACDVWLHTRVSLISKTSTQNVNCEKMMTSVFVIEAGIEIELTGNFIYTEHTKKY